MGRALVSIGCALFAGSAGLGCGPPVRGAVESAAPSPAGLADPVEDRGLLPIRVPEGTDAAPYLDAVLEAEAIVETFVGRYGFEEHVERRAFDRVEVFATRAALWQRVLVLFDAPEDTPMPAGPPVAALEARVLLTVTEAEYRAAHPEYASGPEPLAKLLAHELLHQVHVAIVEGEEAMGPRWFYEGFAVVASGQDFDRGHLAFETEAEALAAAHRATEPELAYRRYAAAFRFFLTRIPLVELLRLPTHPDFEQELRRLSR